ncbi:hypothetical protein [Wolbachia endosymbiont of Erebia cassioides]|uniref:hypothetical protein n=1 Tax=Wolbachia endosymbiont of Erebia cassioides TaxID=2803379 RepID=UPI001BDBC96B|nr:hypothetical protein [Wolbachia endosymbiont of Erebia cassioides]
MNVPNNFTESKDSNADGRDKQEDKLKHRLRGVHVAVHFRLTSIVRLGYNMN